MIQALIPVLGSLFGKAIDRAIPDKDEAERLKASITMEVMKFETTELQSATSVITAEATSGNVLAASWRPITMLTFVALIVAHWLGFTADNLPDEQVLALLDIVKVGLGGYVLGRSGEKIAKVWKS